MKVLLVEDQVLMKYHIGFHYNRFATCPYDDRNGLTHPQIGSKMLHENNYDRKLGGEKKQASLNLVAEQVGDLD